MPDLGGLGGRTQMRRWLGVPVDAEVIGFFGFVHPVKGVRYLIEALAALRAAGRERLHLLVLGGFTSLALPAAEAAAFRSELTGLAREHGVTEHVTFTGHRPAAGDLRRAARLRPGRVPVHGRGDDEERRPAVGLRAPAAHRGDRGRAARSRARRRAGRSWSRRGCAARRRWSRRSDGCSTTHALRARVAAGGAAIGAERTWPRIADAHRALYRDVLSAGPVRDDHRV